MKEITIILNDNKDVRYLEAMLSMGYMQMSKAVNECVTETADEKLEQIDRLKETFYQVKDQIKVQAWDYLE